MSEKMEVVFGKTCQSTGHFQINFQLELDDGSQSFLETLSIQHGVLWMGVPSPVILTKESLYDLQTLTSLVSHNLMTSLDDVYDSWSGTKIIICGWSCSSITWVCLLILTSALCCKISIMFTRSATWLFTSQRLDFCQGLQILLLLIRGRQNLSYFKR